MANARLRGIPLWQFFDSTGAVLASGTINFYVPGTTTDKDIYKDTGKAATADNPVTLDAAGRVPYALFGDGFYDVVVKDSAGSTQMTISNWGDDWSAVGTDLSANPLSNHSFETAGSGSEAFANWTETDPGALITRDTSDQSHGAASAKFTLSQNSEEYITSDIFEWEELETMRIKFDVKANNATAQPKVVVEWFDSAQSTISTTTAYLGDNGATPTSWTRTTVQASPAANTAYAKLIVYGNAHATQYTTNYDNFYLDVVPSVENLGLVIRPRFVRASATTITITAGAYHHSGTTDQIVYWNSDLTFTAQSGGSNSDSSGLAGGAEHHYLYIDDSAVVTANTNVLTASEFLNSTTAPTWNATKHGWYNGNDRAIFFFLSDAGSSMEIFQHNGGREVFFETADPVTGGDIDTTWTAVDFDAPSAWRPAWTHEVLYGAASDPAYTFELWRWRPVGSSTVVGHYLAGEVAGGSAPGAVNTGRVMVDDNGQIEVVANASDTSELFIQIQGWVLPEGT